MDIYNYLKKDHRKVSSLMNKVVKSSRQSEREALFLEIKKELELHSDPERDTFYKALKNFTEHAEEEVEHATEEHNDIKTALKKVSKANNKDVWLINFGELKSIVEHHVEEEENEIFKEAKKYLSDSQAESIAEDMDALKKQKENGSVFTKLFGKTTAKKKNSKKRKK